MDFEGFDDLELIEDEEKAESTQLTLTESQRLNSKPSVWKKTSNINVLRCVSSIMVTDKLTFFGDSYVKQESLGDPGAFGITYACYRRSDAEQHKYAVKQINKAKFYLIEENARANILQLMKNEIEISQKLQHPNIVNIIDVFEDRNYIYLVMDYLSGGELFARISENDSLSENEAANITKQILRALSYMHAHNICHLDLKPDNIMFEHKGKDAKIKLIDFGMSQVVPRLQKVQQTVGTPYYTAPEVIDGRYDRAADVWSVGVILFCMLFGFPPFYVDIDCLKMGQTEDGAIYEAISKGFNPNVLPGYGAWFPADIPMPENALSIISGMLQFKDRMTVSECLAHPWIRCKSQDKRLPQTVFDSLANFTGTCRFKTLIAKMFAQKLDSHRYAQTLEVFKKWDIDGDGEITLKEFRKGMMECTDLNEHEIDEIFSNLDQDESRSITIDEFMFAASFDALVSVDERLHDAFASLDKDGNGTLELSELRNAIEETFGGSIMEKEMAHISEIIDEIDVNNDGCIDYEEFLEALHPQYHNTDEEQTPGTFRLKSRGFGSFDESHLKALVVQSPQQNLIETLFEKSTSEPNPKFEEKDEFRDITDHDFGANIGMKRVPTDSYKGNNDSRMRVQVENFDEMEYKEMERCAMQEMKHKLNAIENVLQEMTDKRANDSETIRQLKLEILEIKRQRLGMEENDTESFCGIIAGKVKLCVIL